MFRDKCIGPHCNEECPDELLLERQTAESWSLGSKIAISLVVVGIAVMCLLGKVRHAFVLFSRK